MTIDWAAPSLRDIAGARTAIGAFERAGMSPRMALLTWQGAIRQVNVRDILGSVRVPTLVLHRKDDAVPVECGRELAAKIPGARLVELDGVDHMPVVGDMKSITGEVEEFLTGHRYEHRIDRMLATVLFTDIVDSPGTRRSSATDAGAGCWTFTTNSPVPRSMHSRVASSNTPGTEYWRRSTAPRERFCAPQQLLTACRR
jgi:TAP-like protein